MLNIYLGEENLPKDKKFIRDADGFCFGLETKDDEFTKLVLDKIEHAKRVDKSIFSDRYGRGLYNTCLSTGTKALLAVKYFPEYVINLSEVGTNAIAMLCEIKDGSVYFDRVFVDLIDICDPIMVNGEYCSDGQDAELFIECGEHYID